MNCALCNGKVDKVEGSIDFDTRSLGRVSVPNIEYLKCTNCGDILLTTEQSDWVSKFIADEEQQFINKIPISEFISLNEAAAVLGITKQAFSKHPKIKNGLIFSATISNRKFYNKRSVDLFKREGNGKYLLPPSKKQVRKYSLGNVINVDFPARADEDSNKITGEDLLSAES